MAKRSTYDEIGYGEWTRPRMRDFRKQCCDCGLIHRLDFRIVDATKGRSRPSSPKKRARTPVVAINKRTCTPVVAINKRAFKLVATSPRRVPHPPRRPRHRRRAPPFPVRIGRIEHGHTLTSIGER